LSSFGIDYGFVFHPVAVQGGQLKYFNGQERSDVKLFEWIFSLFTSLVNNEE
jgi:hypothetical protein